MSLLWLYPVSSSKPRARALVDVDERSGCAKRWLLYTVSAMKSGWRRAGVVKAHGKQHGMRLATGLTLIGVILVASTGVPGAEITVSTDFEGGSAKVEAINSERREILIRPGGDPARGWPCWWYLRIDGLTAAEDAKVVVLGSEQPARNNGRSTGKPLAPDWALPDRAVISVDGATWLQTEPGTKKGDGVSYRVIGNGGPLWVAWGPPFTSRERDDLFVRFLAGSRGTASVFELARSREGRLVRGLRVVAPGQHRAPAVWVQARQHAWESGSSWVARGFMEWLLGDEPDAIWLRKHAEVCVVPIMDVDRVATGDGGKESDPHDHNRDWSEAALYPEIGATQRRLKAFAAEDRLDVFLDLHNPGPADRLPFLFVPPADVLTDDARANQARFLACASRQFDAPLTLEPSPRKTDSVYHPRWRQISFAWVSEHIAADTVAVCLETPWNTPHSTTAGYRAVGSNLGRAVTHYLRTRANGGDGIAPELPH